MPDPCLAAYAEDLLDGLCGSQPIGYRPSIVWKRLRVTAGVAYYEARKIALSSVVLTDESRLRETLIHEYAHLVAVARYGRKAAGHGQAWKAAMLELGLDPKVRHSYPVQRNARRQQVGYTCLKCGQTFVRSRRLPRKRKYVHAPCGGAIRFAWAREATDQPKQS